MIEAVPRKHKPAKKWDFDSLKNYKQIEKEAGYKPPKKKPKDKLDEVSINKIKKFKKKKYTSKTSKKLSRWATKKGNKRNARFFKGLGFRR